VAHRQRNRCGTRVEQRGCCEGAHTVAEVLHQRRAESKKRGGQQRQQAALEGW
jgi:hypothetical protein